MDFPRDCRVNKRWVLYGSGNEESVINPMNGIFKFEKESGRKQ